MARARLSRLEWITAGLKVLAAEGVDAVRVERLAADLRVTKGSFYWHFTDRSALLAALLEAWEERATNDVITMVETRGGDARARAHSLLTIAFGANGGLDLAVRAWASRGDAAVSALLARIDRRRTAYVMRLFEDLGFSANEAATRARLVYVALIGQFTGGASGVGPALKVPADLEVFLELLVRGHEGAVGASARTRRRPPRS